MITIKLKQDVWIGGVKQLAESNILVDESFAATLISEYKAYAPDGWNAFPDTSNGGATLTSLSLTLAQASSPFSVAGKSSIIIGKLTSDLVVADPTSAEVGQVLTYSFEQDSLGGHALTVHGVEMPLGLAEQVLACQFQYRGGGKWAQMFGTIPWSGTPSAVGFGDSASLNAWTSLTGLVV